MSRETAITRTPSVAAGPQPSPWAGLSRKSRMHEGPETRAFLDRATAYVRAGLVLNLSGAAGLGKTTLALRIAEEIGRPVAFMTGNQWLTARDFVGREVGQTERTVIDKYVQSVHRTETESRAEWRSGILALSMQRGYTLVYDEFTRAAPEANSTLLSVLEEGVLVATDRAADRSYVTAHDDFRIILTSNPHDYAGVNGAPDALMDRVVTLPLPRPGADQLAGMIAANSGLDHATATRIATLVLTFHAEVEVDASPLRTAMLIARALAWSVRHGRLRQLGLAEIAGDVLRGRGLPADPARIAEALGPQQGPVRRRDTPRAGPEPSPSQDPEPTP